MTTDINTLETDRHGSQAGQWGLAAFLLGSLLLILFPLAVILALGLLIGAWEVDPVELRHIDYAVIAGKVLVYGLLGLAGFAVVSGLLGMRAAVRRRQPIGLAIGGTLVALMALVAMIVLVQIGLYIIEDTHRLRTQHPRFRPASARLVKQVQQALEEDPGLRAEWEKAIADGTLTQADAEAILRKAYARKADALARPK